MGIPISKYIDISTAVVPAGGGERNFAGLLFTTETMKTGAVDKSLFESTSATNVLKFDLKRISTEFGDSTETYKFASEYYGTTNRQGNSPDTLNVVFVRTDETAESAYNRVLDSFSDFGACAFVGTGITVGTKGSHGLLDVAGLVADMYVLAVGTDADGFEDDSEALMNAAGVNLSYHPATVVGWVACSDYSKANASGTMDYEEFPIDADVTDGDTKDVLDEARVNYMGRVQSRGINRKFWQTGVNMDGVDLGAYVDSLWIRSQIEAGWFALATATKVPANAYGASMVRSIVTNTAERALVNGCILVDKPLTDMQITAINNYAGVGGASTTVESSGYFVSTKIIPQDDKYVVQYTLIYAKGDHVGKVVGTHYLV